MEGIQPKPININTMYGGYKSGGNIDVGKYKNVADADANVKLADVEKKAFNQILGEMFQPKNSAVV